MKSTCILHIRMCFALKRLEICKDEVYALKFAALWSHTHNRWQSGNAAKRQQFKE